MLNVSFVLYQPNWKQVADLTEVILQLEKVNHVYWIDNSPLETSHLPLQSPKITYNHNADNLGYGAAHNIAIRETIYQRLSHHLVINSDIQVDARDLESLYDFLLSHNEVGSLMPKVINPNGDMQYLCKLLPSPIDVFGRRFLPSSWMRGRNARYELRDADYNRPMNVPYLSGCFMFLRTEAVLKARLFDERFFMYPEDVDLTRRIHRDYLTVYYPHTTIIHNHAKASYRSLRMLWVHIVNMCRYFNKWGWWHDPERKMMNDLAINEYINSFILFQNLCINFLYVVLTGNVAF